MLTGRVPFTGTDYQIQHGHVSAKPDLEALPSDVPPWLRNSLSQALAKEPAARFEDYRAFRRALSPDGDVGHRQAPAAERRFKHFRDFGHYTRWDPELVAEPASRAGLRRICCHFW